MKKTFWTMASLAVAAVACILMSSCEADHHQSGYLRKVLAKLDQIESATYTTTSEGWAPGDTAAYATYHHYVKEFRNPADTSIGSSYVSLLGEDTTQMTFCYDGTMRAMAYEDEKAIVVDSFTVRILPFRPLNPPFFNYAESILKYALETKDSISIVTDDFGDSVRVQLAIFEDEQVEFFGEAHQLDNPYSTDETSRYEIWIDTSTDLPYKIRREMSYDISVTTCNNVTLNKGKLAHFRASDYFQPNFTIKAYGKKLDTTHITLAGTVAPDWMLKNVNNTSISLKQLKSKVLMIQFTSVSCGPCNASVPFLKKLNTDYKKEDVDFVAIESFNRNPAVLESYRRRNNFNYTFLLSTKEVTKAYQVKSVPVFFILDENRVIRKVINGYGKGTTDKEIRSAIAELM